MGMGMKADLTPEWLQEFEEEAEYSMRLTHEQKEVAIAGMRLLGTKKAGAIAANITVDKLNAEIKKSAVFRKRVMAR